MKLVPGACETGAWVSGMVSVPDTAGLHKTGEDILEEEVESAEATGGVSCGLTTEGLFSATLLLVGDVDSEKCGDVSLGDEFSKGSGGLAQSGWLFGEPELFALFKLTGDFWSLQGWEAGELGGLERFIGVDSKAESIWLFVSCEVCGILNFEIGDWLPLRLAPSGTGDFDLVLAAEVSLSKSGDCLFSETSMTGEVLELCSGIDTGGDL